MAMSYVMSLDGARLGKPKSFVEWLGETIFGKGPIKTTGPQPSGSLHGPWQLLNERQGERMNTIVPAGIAPYYAGGGGGAGVPITPGWMMRPGANLPMMPTPRPLQGAQLGDITDVIMANPIALILGVGIGIYIASRGKK